jgi:hypothetical protein
MHVWWGGGSLRKLLMMDGYRPLSAIQGSIAWFATIHGLSQVGAWVWTTCEPCMAASLVALLVTKLLLWQHMRVVSALFQALQAGLSLWQYRQAWQRHRPGLVQGECVPGT